MRTEAKSQRRVRRSAAVLLLGCAALCAPIDARAAPADDFRAAVAALENGAFDDAVDKFEHLADQGFVHPDAALHAFELAL